MSLIFYFEYCLKRLRCITGKMITSNQPHEPSTNFWSTCGLWFQYLLHLQNFCNAVWICHICAPLKIHCGIWRWSIYFTSTLFRLDLHGHCYGYAWELIDNFMRFRSIVIVPSSVITFVLLDFPQLTVLLGFLFYDHKAWALSTLLYFLWPWLISHQVKG